MEGLLRLMGPPQEETVAVRQLVVCQRRGRDSAWVPGRRSASSRDVRGAQGAEQANDWSQNKQTTGGFLHL